MANRVDHSDGAALLVIPPRSNGDTDNGCSDTTPDAEGKLEKIKKFIKSFCGFELSDEEKKSWECQQMLIAHHCHVHMGDGTVQSDGEGTETNVTLMPWRESASASVSPQQSSCVDGGGLTIKAVKLEVIELLWNSMKKAPSWIRSKCTPHVGRDFTDGAFDELKAGWLSRQSVEGLLNLKYKYTDSKLNKEVHKAAKQRPYFTYWLLFVHIIIMIITLSLYHFAPYQWNVTTTTAFVQMSTLTLEAAKKDVTGSVWGGPDLESLVSLGAKYAPCMRRDRKLYIAIEAEGVNEATNSGCCVRRDKSGCVQVLAASNCPATYADFYYQYNDTESNGPVRAVCGTSPYSCIDPDPFKNPSWNGNISNWPICQQSSQSSYPHLSCELTGRPCCVGLQAQCLITTSEHCMFLGGHYHSNAFLCSQVDCLSGVCGLIPFAVKDHPDQFYRLWLSLFLHAGIIHILLTSLFMFFVLRVIEKKLGWLRTSFVYILSGVGGNIISAVFVPYYPEVGPGPSMFGLVAYIIVFLIMESPYLLRPCLVLPVVLIIVGLSLVAGVLFPFIDNWGHFGGLMFGFFLSWIVVQYKPFDEEIVKLYEKSVKTKTVLDDIKTKQKRTKKLKCCMMGISIPLSLILFVICLTWFYAGQDNWFGFTYFNCIPYTETFCVDYGQTLKSRNSY